MTNRFNDNAGDARAHPRQSTVVVSRKSSILGTELSVTSVVVIVLVTLVGTICIAKGIVSSDTIKYLWLNPELLVGFGLAIWTYYDAKNRKDKTPVGWSIGVFLLAVIVLPLYLAKRPLLAGESREGGTGWNTLKGFAIVWTIFAIYICFSRVPALIQAQQLEGWQAGVLYGWVWLFWFIPLVGALVLGLFLKRSWVIERAQQGSESPSGTTNTAELKPCVDCAEPIRLAARKCRFCGALQERL